MLLPIVLHLNLIGVFYDRIKNNIQFTSEKTLVISWWRNSTVLQTHSKGQIVSCAIKAHKSKCAISVYDVRPAVVTDFCYLPILLTFKINSKTRLNVVNFPNDPSFFG